MVEIILTATTEKKPSKYTTYEISVEKKLYSKSKLFYSFDHQLTNPYTNNFDICKDEHCKNKLILDRGKTYENKKLTNVHVYFNEYYTNKQHPLIFVLLFENDQEQKVENKYYKASDFNTKFNSKVITASHTVSIPTFTNYDDENSIIADLLKENDLLDDLLTYDIEKKQGGEGLTSDDMYNGRKITVKIDSSSHPKLPSTGYNRYKHTPLGGRNSKKACVLYNNDLLIGENKMQISNIQNKNYSYISVYYSDNVAEPLLVELATNNLRSNSNEYYYHFRGDDNSLYWKKIEQRSHKVFDIQFDSRSDIFSQFNGQLTTRFHGLLNKLRSQFHKSVFFLTDRKIDYNDLDVKSVFVKHNKFKLINNSKKIIVKDQTNINSKCLEKTGFTVYAHDFTSNVGDMGSEKFQLKFIVPSSKNNSYSAITLFNHERTSGQDVEILLYKLSYNKLYVWFCDVDPRPLLVCYADIVYKPKDLSSYNSNWVKVNNIGKCLCQDRSRSSELVKTLSDVSRFLNPVYLHNVVDYTVHKFNGTDIKINVAKTDLTCYYKYEHTYLNKMYRLGNIEYNFNRNKGTLKYFNPSDYSFLTTVATYYYKEDAKKEYPLIVELQFKGDNKKSYYKLNSVISSLSWSSLNLESVDSYYKLLDQLFKLNQNFNGTKTPKKDECIPSDNTSSIAGGVGGTTVILGGGGVAGGVLYYKYPGLVLSLISKIAGK